MLGVWIEPVTAQLMMTFLAISLSDVTGRSSLFMF